MNDFFTFLYFPILKFTNVLFLLSVGREAYFFLKVKKEERKISRSPWQELRKKKNSRFYIAGQRKEQSGRVKALHSGVLSRPI